MWLWFRRWGLWLANLLALAGILLLAHRLLLTRQPPAPLRLPTNRPVALGQTVDGLQVIQLDNRLVAVWRIHLGPGRSQIQLAQTENGHFGAPQALSPIGVVKQPQLVQTGADSALVAWADPALETVAVTGAVISPRSSLGELTGPDPFSLLSAHGQATMVWENTTGLNTVAATSHGFGRRVLLGQPDPGSSWAATLNPAAHLAVMWAQQDQLTLATRASVQGQVVRQTFQRQLSLADPALSLSAGNHVTLAVTSASGQVSLAHPTTLENFTVPKQTVITRQPNQAFFWLPERQHSLLVWVSADGQLQFASSNRLQHIIPVSQAPASDIQMLVSNGQLVFSWHDIGTSDILARTCSPLGTCQPLVSVAQASRINGRVGQLSPPALVADGKTVRVVWFRPQLLGGKIVVSLAETDLATNPITSSPTVPTTNLPIVTTSTTPASSATTSSPPVPTTTHSPTTSSPTIMTTATTVVPATPSSPPITTTATTVVPATTSSPPVTRTITPTVTTTVISPTTRSLTVTTTVAPPTVTTTTATPAAP